MCLLAVGAYGLIGFRQSECLGKWSYLLYVACFFFMAMISSHAKLLSEKDKHIERKISCKGAIFKRAEFTFFIENKFTIN